MVNENLRVVISKKMMKDGLLRCLKRKNLERLSISELCRESQVNRATFYNHYGSPKDILTEICWDHAREIQKIAEESKGASTEERLTKCLSYIYDNKDSVLTIKDASVDEETTNANMEALIYGLRQVMDVRSTVDLDDTEYKLATTYYSRAILYTICQWLTGEVDKTPKEIAQFLMKLTPAEIYR